MMIKAVIYKGEKIKIRFENVHISRDLNTNDRKENTSNFIINGKSYKVNSISKRGRVGKFSTTLIYNGINFPDSEKKVIEFILSE